MTKLTDVQKIEVENFKGLILKLRDELDESMSEMLDVLGNVYETSHHLENRFAEFYHWLDGEQLTFNPDQDSKEFVKGKMKSWKNLPGISWSQVSELKKSARAQVMQRLDQISNELNEIEFEQDCG